MRNAMIGAKPHERLLPARCEIRLEDPAWDRVGLVVVAIVAAGHKVRRFIVVLVGILVVQLEMDPAESIRASFPWLYDPVDDKPLNDP
jgi:hypothetical protein